MSEVEWIGVLAALVVVAVVEFAAGSARIVTRRPTRYTDAGVDLMVSLLAGWVLLRALSSTESNAFSLSMRPLAVLLLGVGWIKVARVCVEGVAIVGRHGLPVRLRARLAAISCLAMVSSVGGLAWLGSRGQRGRKPTGAGLENPDRTRTWRSGNVVS